MEIKKGLPRDTVDILIVEDSPTQAEQLKYVLEQHHYRVTAANSGRQALALVDKHKPALVISDIVMMEMNGFELCQQIKSNESTRDIPVILLTALSSSEDVLEGLACGADSFITKPYSEEYLLLHVEHILANKKLWQDERVCVGMEVLFAGKRRFITSNVQQMLTLLLSTYEEAVHRNTDLIQAQDELRSLNERLEDLVEARTAALSAEIAERKQAEARVRRLSQVYAVLSDTNQAIVRVREPQALFETACRIAVEKGNFRMTWIGLLDLQTKEIRPAAHAGETDGYLEKLRIVLDDSPRGRGPTANALRIGQHVIVNDIEQDPRMAPWREDALRRGYRSSAAFPLRVNGETRGTINLYASEPDFFDEEEIKLLDELALDISFAMEFAEKEADHRRAEAALRALAARQEALLAAIPDIIMEVDNNKVYVWANQAGIEFFGEDVIGKEAAFYFEGEQDTYAVVQPLFNGDESTIYVESWQRRKDGQKRLLAWWCGVLKDDHGNAIGALSSARDITESKRVEVALRESEERFRSLYENSTVGLYRTTPDGRILLANPTLVRILGYSSLDELATRELEKHGFEPSYDRAQFLERIERDGEVEGLESSWTRRDGTAIFVRESARAIRDLQGKTLYYDGTVEDITERKRAEDEIRRLNAELEQRVRERTAQLEAANKELEAFAYSVSHDLRAPLRGIDGWSLALLEDYYDQLDEQARQYLDYVRSEAQRMGRLIDDLLQLSRVTRAEMQTSAVDLTALAQTVAARLRATQPERQVEVVIQPGLMAYGDAALLEIVLTNLLGNAWKFSGTRCPARIEFGCLTHPTPPPKVREGKEGVIYFVRDNGVGFDMAYAQNLFGAFQRMHRASEFPGTGIGLATVQRIVHRHGGRVWAEAHVNQGATFYFTLEEVT